MVCSVGGSASHSAHFILLLNPLTSCDGQGDSSIMSHLPWLVVNADSLLRQTVEISPTGHVQNELSCSISDDQAYFSPPPTYCIFAVLFVVTDPVFVPGDLAFNLCACCRCLISFSSLPYLFMCWRSNASSSSVVASVACTTYLRCPVPSILSTIFVLLVTIVCRLSPRRPAF